MKRPHLDWPGTAMPSLLAALTTWVALWSWAGFVQSPSGYLVPALGAVLLVAACGALLRSARVPTILVVVAQLALLTLWLTHRWAAEAALGGWLPTPSSVREVLVVLRDSAVAAQAYGAPVGDSVPQIFPILIAASALVAVLVDFLACGLRRVPVAGLPLLALYTAPVSILAGGVPWWVFAAGAVSFLSLLTSDEGRRLMSWGRRVPRGESVFDSGGGSVNPESIRTSARRIGLTATGLAVVAPLVIPTLGTELLTGNGPGGEGGGEAVNISNPMLDLRRDLVRGSDVNLLTVTTDNANPTYLRLSVLDSFNGVTWKPSEREIPSEQRAQGPLPPPPGLESQTPRKQVDYQVSIEDAFDSTWLPTPYPVTTIDAPGDWRYDTETFDFISAVEGQTTGGLDYSLTALEVTPRAQDLLSAGPPPESIYTPYTELPEDLPDVVTNLARDLTTGLDTKFEKAVRLQRWFREDGGFEYSLRRASGNGADDLAAFLSTGPGGRIGYCEQFAAAMAVMGRTIGIPSRVAVGFLRPTVLGDDRYVYSAHDLHAWPEMYFDGVGWVRFEPTPGDRAEDVPGYTAGQFNTPQPTDLPSASASSQPTPDVPRNPRKEDAAAAGGGSGSGGDGIAWTAVVVGLVAAVGLVVPRLTRSAVRRRRWANARTPAEVAEAGWRELRDVALDLRLQWSDTVTLRTAARALAGSFGRLDADQQQGYVRGGSRGATANPEAARALERLVKDLELARYARASTSPTGRGADEVAADVELCADALRAGATKKHRRRATWLPASLVKNREWRSLVQNRSAGGPVVAEAGVDRAV